MSVTDPLLKTLKLQILELHHSFQLQEKDAIEGCGAADVQKKGENLSFRSNAVPINDDHPHLLPLCQTLEEIFRKGLVLTSGSILSLSSKKDNFWQWIEPLGEVRYSSTYKPSSTLTSTINLAKNNEKVLTYVGSGRIFIRAALCKKSLCLLVDSFLSLHQYSNASTNYYDPRYSILGDEILVQILLSLLRQLATFNFDLDLNNSSFLDTSWRLPLRKHYEMVPCVDLGVALKHVASRMMVAAVEPGSVAGEDRKIEAGDVFDEIFGKCLRKAKRGRVAKLMSENRGRPISVTVIKCKLKSGDIFPPLLNIVRQMSNEVEIQRLLKEEEQFRKTSKKPPSTILEDDDSDLVPAQNPLDNPTYKVAYLGEVPVGETGGVNRIEEGVGTALVQFKEHRLEVTLNLGEKDVTVVESGAKAEPKCILKHAYPEISSCGRRVDCRKFFAYIAGETTCTISTKFVCHVFEARSEVESKNILCGIAQGFERTHWAI